MNAKLAHVHEQFIEMGFTPYDDDECLLMHPDYPETDEHQNTIYFEDDEIITDFDDNINVCVTNKLKPAILNYYATGPFFGYDEFKLTLIDWGIKNAIVYCTLRVGTIDVFPYSFDLYYNIVTQTYETSEGDTDTLLEMVDANKSEYELDYAREIIEIYDRVYKNAPKKSNTTYIDDLYERGLKKLGFVKIAQDEYKHPNFDGDENILRTAIGGAVVRGLSSELQQYILEQCHAAAQSNAAHSIREFEKYGLVIGEWKVARRGLIADIACTHIPLFHSCVSEYNIMSSTSILVINGAGMYSDFRSYITVENIHEIILPAISERLLEMIDKKLAVEPRPE